MPESPENLDAPPSPGANVHEFTVSELSAALKRTIEESYGHVRVRGELGRVSRPSSGHIYLDLKDDKAVLSGVIWRGTAQGLRVQPEQGLEVIVTGRLTTYPGQSRYQIVIESLEPAGAGALMALLEERRKKLAAEGLFDPARKKQLPFLPDVIGVVTSPTGAVIRDILHRLADRFPRHVLVWPVLVQGEGAAEQVAAAIRGFNVLGQGEVPRPDVLIVARGGGSIEDLWAFNEEVVVRAAAASAIPLISAVGHETDTTLIDHAADRRAPTPTAAAEIAVPVRADLMADVLDKERRLIRALARLAEDRRARLDGLARGLPRPDDLVALSAQRFDAAAGRLGPALALSLRAPREMLARAAARLQPSGLRALARQGRERLDGLAGRMAAAQTRRLERAADRFGAQAKLLNSLGYTQTLSRGFALVRAKDGALVRSVAQATPGREVALQFADGSAPAVIGGARPGGRAPSPATQDRKGGGQGSLFGDEWK